MEWTFQIKWRRTGSCIREESPLDNADGPMIRTFVFRSIGGFELVAPQSIPVKELSGDHLLYLVFEGRRGICNLNSFRFLSAELNPANRNT